VKNLFLIAIAAAAVGGATSTTAAEYKSYLPTFELTGVPITSHQVAVLGATHVQERVAAPLLTFGGMPASPHQIAVLRPRAEMTATAVAVKPVAVDRGG
jgi:hypothetical protein